MKRFLLLLSLVLLVFQGNLYSQNMDDELDAIMNDESNVQNVTDTNLITNTNPQEKTKVEKLLDKYKPIILLNNGKLKDDQYVYKNFNDILSKLKEDKLYVKDLYYIYKQDVLNYYKLTAKYNTPLKVKIFKKSKEYKEKLLELKKLKIKYKRKYFCVIDRPIVSNFDVEKSRFKIKSRYCYSDAYHAWGGCSDYSITDFVLWDYPVKDEKSGADNPYYYTFGVFMNNKIKGFCSPGYGGYYYYLPIKDDSIALNIENNKNKIIVIYLFKIKGTKIVRVNNYERYKFITVKNLKLIVSNADTGEIYLIKKIK